jgi:DNA repair exonuclease SbcCD ATPase subunit
MKYLESVKLVQFFLFEKQDIRVQEITGIFGPNGSGKSTLIDALQIAMFGANGRLVNLNAQADEKSSTTRTIRSYCLGALDEAKRARDSATTYITMVWRDSETKAPLSMGVCLYASVDTESHEVRGRYIVPGIELAMQDHLEVVDNEERPRAWETFRHQLIERSKVSGEDPLFSDSERYIKAALLALRGSGGAPTIEAFKSAFRFGLRMRFDKSVDNIVRNDVLEARPTNIQKFKEVTESFRRLVKVVADVKAKIEDGDKVEAEFAKAAAASVRTTTWEGLSCLVNREAESESMNRATEAKQGAEHALNSLNEEAFNANQELELALKEERLNRELRVNHPAHKEHGELQGDISKAAEVEGKKIQDIKNSLSMIRRTLNDAANSTHLKSNADAIKTVISSLDAALPTSHEMRKDQLAAVLKPVVKQASAAISELFDVSRSVANLLSESESSLKTSKEAASRVNKGYARLSNDTDRLIAELRDHGLHPTPVCDLVRITDPEWQPVIESYLGHNVEALLVEEKEEKAAFSVYRGLTGPRAIYGAKIVAASKQGFVATAPGTVAELIEGSHPAAVAYLRKRFGDMLRATTDAEAMAGHRTMTQDGMVVQFGEYERKKPLAQSSLKIGGGDKSQKDALAREISQLEERIRKLTSQHGEIKGLIEALSPISNEATIMKHMLDASEEMHEARSKANSLSQRLNNSADAEYSRLGALELEWGKKAQVLKPKVEQYQRDIGGAEQKLEQCVKQEGEAIVKWEKAKSAAEIAVGVKEYDGDYASQQWDVLLEKHGDQYPEMAEYCVSQSKVARKIMDNAIARGASELGTFKEKYREQGMVRADDWRNEREWINALLKRLRDTELSDYEGQMKDAFKASQETFRSDVAIALSNNIDHLNSSLDRLNRVLSASPVFSNGERYQFVRKVRPQLQNLLSFVKDIAIHGPNDDLLGGAGEMPEEFRQLLDDKVAPGIAGMQSPLDDYREFFEFDIEILHEDSVTKLSSRVGTLSKRLGTGSGGEHRAPLYVIAGAALASAYRLDSGHTDGIRLILLDEAFNKMDTGNIVATMRYLEQLGLQIFMASPGDNLGTLTAFLHRYYDILRDAENNAIMIQGHDVSELDRELFRSDLAEFNEELVAQELAAIRASRLPAKSTEIVS